MGEWLPAPYYTPHTHYLVMWSMKCLKSRERGREVLKPQKVGNPPLWRWPLSTAVLEGRKEGRKEIKPKLASSSLSHFTSGHSLSLALPVGGVAEKEKKNHPRTFKKTLKKKSEKKEK